jgi:drug/metabolite transporter (DMT)-like permease
MPSPAPDAAARRAAAIALLAVVVIWGFNFTVSKWALQELPPLAFTALRFALASALFGGMLALSSDGFAIPRGSILRLAALGVVGNTLYQLAFILGLARTTVTNSSLLLAGMPAMVAGLGAALGAERLTVAGRRGLVLASVGVVIVVAAKGGVGFSGRTLSGDLLTLAAVLCWALFTIGVRRLRTPMSPFGITAWTMILGSPGLVLAGVPDLLRLDWGSVSLLAWGGVLYSVVLSLIVAYILWNRSVRVVGSNRTAIFACMTPIVAMAVAAAVLGERPRPVQFVGAALILGGVLLAQTGGTDDAKREVPRAAKG